jgi:ApaG protein
LCAARRLDAKTGRSVHNGLGHRARMLTVKIDKHNIEVTVKTAYVAAQSAPESNRYVFAYTITITNSGDVPARLLGRHWVITDANQKTQEVRGEGVVGEQPYLIPGMSFEYTSGTILETPVGVMRGSYRMEAEDGTHFDAEIPAFTLSVPRTLH